MDKVNILGCLIDNVRFDAAVQKICDFVENRKNALIVTPNIDHVVKLIHDPEFRNIYTHANLVLADGMPLLWAARFLGTPIEERISGADLFSRLCEVSAKKGYKLFFLGGREGAATKAADVLRLKYTGVKIVGIYSPSFGFENIKEENDEIVKLIKDAKPDILFVGLGAPKQEKWICAHKNECRVPVSIGIGVSFEFVSGVIKRAPLWMQKAGLEWFWRLTMEPRRLWKRYLIDDPKFFWLIIKQKVGRL